MEKVNLFKILEDSGVDGLIMFLKLKSNKELREVANQILIKQIRKNAIIDRDKVIKDVLLTMERYINIGYVFSITQERVELARYYN